MDTIYQKESINSALAAIFAETAEAIAHISEADFVASREPKWSVAEIFDHLIRSSKPVASGLKMPKVVFRNFGKPNRPSRTYDALVMRYKERLAEGGRSTGPYSPKAGTIFNKEAMLLEWQETGEKLVRRLEKHWEEDKMDEYLVPHPLLGKLTIREIMFFTIYHTHHHLAQIRHGQ